MKSIRLLIVSGSERAGSLNKKLSKVAATAARLAGASVTEFDLRALGLPVYDGDIQAAQGIPASAGTLRDALQAHDALLVVTPEYNGFPTPLVLNAFDWLSRIPATDPAGGGLAATTNKPAGLLSASPGALGGLRSMTLLRQYLHGFAFIVVPQQFALGHAAEAFDESGALKDARSQQLVEGVLNALADVAAALKAAKT